MKAIPSVKPVFAGAAMAAALSFLMSDLALAQDAVKAEAGIKAMAAFKGIAVNEVKASGKHFTVKLGTKKIPAIAFNTGTASKPIWNVGIYPKSVVLKSAYGKAPLAKLLTPLAPSNSAVVITAAKWSKNVSVLPKPVRDGISKVFGSKAKSVGFLAGINYSFIADMAKVPGLTVLKSTLGVSKTKVAVFGQVGEDFIRYLANGTAGSKPNELAKISLTAAMGPIKPAKVSRYVSAKSLFVTLRADAKGLVKLGGQAVMAVTVGKAKLEFPSAFQFDAKAKGADKSLISMRGGVKVLPKSFGGQQVRKLGLNARVTGEKKLAVGFIGEVLIKKKPLTFVADLSFAKLPPQLNLSVTGNLTVADVLGVNVPGIGGLAFKNALFSPDHVSGTVAFRGVNTSAVVVRSGKRKPVLALLHKKFDAGVYLPGIKGSVLDQAEIRDTAMIIVPKGAAQAKTKARDLPGPVEATIKAAIGSTREFELKEGVNIVGAFDVRKSNVLKTLLGFVSIKQTALPFTGSVSTDVLVNPTKPGTAAFTGKAPSVKTPRKPRYSFPSMSSFKAPNVRGAKKPAFTVPKSAVLSGMAKAILGSLDIQLPIPTPKIPGIEKILTAKGASLHIRGAENPDTGEVIVATAIDGTLTLKAPGKTLTSVGSLTLIKGSGKSIGIGFSSTSTIGWKSAFGIPFLTLNNLGMAGGLVDHGGGNRSFNLGLMSDVTLGAQNVQAVTNLVVENNAIVDISLAIPGEVDIAKLPGIGKIPGINEFAFKDMGIGIGSMYGSMTWKRVGITSQVALMPVNNGMTLMFRVKDTRLSEIVKQVPAPFGDLKFPATVITFSTVDLDDMALGDLPRPFQEILEGIVTRPDGFVPVFDGVSMIGAVGERDFPKQMRDLANKMGIFKSIDGPLILAGGITDFFKVTPKVALYAKLPGLKLPKNQPLSRVVSIDGGSADFFVRANLAALAFQVGLGGEMTIRVPHIDDPKQVDKLTFRGELFGSVDAVSYTGSIKVAGLMKGKWDKPFGYNENAAIEDPAFIIGFDTEGAVEFGVGGNMHIKTRGGKRTIVAKGDFLININFSSSIPLPKKLAMVFQINKIDALTLFEIQEGGIKGVFTGPMAKGILQALPPNERKFALMLQDKLRKASFYDIMQIDKLPLAQLIYTDVDIFFATPGSVIPGREEVLNTIGIRSSGKAEMKAMGKTVKFFEIDQIFTLAEGMRWHGLLKNMTIGGVGLKTAELDIGASWTKGPFFKIEGDAAVLPGFRDHVALNFGTNGIWFTFEKKMGKLGGIKFDARTVGEDIFRSRDFMVTAKATNNINTILTKEIPGKMGIPTVITDLVRKMQPLNIDDVTFEGSLVQFLKGQGVTMKIGHEWFGDRVPPAVITVKPVWADPLKAIPHPVVAAEMTKSFVHYLAANPIDIKEVNLGLVKFEKAKLTAIFTDPLKPNFILGGKVSNFLGGSRDVDVTLSDKGYAFQLHDKIAGGLWDAKLRAWSVGGTALAPHDIKYYGSLSSDFYTWLKKKVGGDLNRSFDAVDRTYKNAQRDLASALAKVKGISALISRKREEAKRELQNLRRLIQQARKALDHSQWLMSRAEGTWRYFQRKHSEARRAGWSPWKWVRVAATWGLEKGAYVAFKAAEVARNASRAAFSGIDKGLTNIPLDLHPKVAPLIVARGVSIGVLQGAKLAFSGAENLNNRFKKVTNALINAVAGAKVLVVNKAVFTGSLRQAKADVHVNVDILDQKNLFQRLSINLLDPAKAGLRELSVMVTALIKGEQVNRNADNLPPPPQLPVATVTKAQIAAAVVAGIKREAARKAQFAREEQNRKMAALAAAGGNLARGKPARQSSRHNNNPNVGPKKAVDGDTNGHYSAAKAMHTNEEQNPWWEVDLGGHYKINEIVVHNQTDCCQDRLDGAVVMLSDWPFIGNPLQARSGDNIERHTLGKAATQNFVKVSGRTARFVRVQIPRRAILSVAEIQVWGEPARLEPGSRWPSGGLAVGKPAYQSSDAQPQAQAMKATDGKAENDISHTREDINPWWEVDLGNHYNIDAVTLFNRVDCCAERLDNAVVMVSDWPFGNDPLQAQSGDNVFRHHLGKSQRVNPVGVRRTGRYVRIQLPRKDYLQLAEVVVSGANRPVKPSTRPTNYVNLAPGKQARQSTTFPGNNGAANAIDGRAGAGALAHTAEGDRTPWWEVDLGAHYNVEKIKIYNRADCCAERMQDGTLMVSDWPIPDYAVQRNGGDNVQRHKLGGIKRVYEAPVRRTARYVRLHLTSGHFLNMTEVQVIGAANRVAASTGRPGVNIAYGKPARLSSQFDGTTVAQIAVNGRTASNGERNLAHSANEAFPWWEVDLGAHYKIGEVRVHNRTDCCAERLNGAAVMISDWPIGQWADNPAVRARDLALSPNPDEGIEAHRIERAVPVNLLNFRGRTARYVRLQLPRPDYLNISEVEIFSADGAQVRPSTQQAALQNAIRNVEADFQRRQAFLARSQQLLMGNGQCLTVTNELNHRKARRVAAADCNNGENQRFERVGSLHIQDINGYCLDYQEQDLIWMHPECPDRNNIKWHIDPRFQRAIENFGDKRCISVDGGTPSLRNCDDRVPSQALALVRPGGPRPQPRGPFEFVMVKDYAGHCLDVDVGTSNIRGARRIIVAGCHGGENQRFTLHNSGEIKTVNGWCLDPQENNQLWAYNCTGNPGMKFERLADGRIRNTGMGGCVDVFQNDSRVGQIVKADRCHGDRNQKFTLVR